MSGVESFKILLENSKEVYIPNEVVRGEVILVTKDVIRSRCICISFQSHTYMAWSIDDGDSKVTYTGSRFYRSLSYTMFGSVYKTGYLIGVYKNAIFGVENGEGLIHIPGHEDEDIPMVLQVMSQEGYKKERLLGHVCINLRDIISWKETRAYQITQPRNKEKAEIILSARLIPASALLLDNNCFIPYMSICELCVHQVIGLNTLMYGAKVKTWVQVFRTQSSILPYDQPPTKSSEAEECVLPAGTLTFPFAFHIRGDVPASAELGAGDESYIRHSLVASIDTQEGWWKDPYVRKVFTVLADRPLPPPNLLFPIRYRTPKPVSLADACSFCCLNYVGHVRADATLARQVLAPGELLPLRVLLNNDSNKVLTVRVDLYRHVTCRQTVMRDSVGKEFRTITPVYQSDVNPGEVWNFDGTLREVRVPAVFPSFLGTVDDPVTFAYSLVVYVRTPGFWGQGFRFSFAVLVSAVPLITAHVLRFDEVRPPINQLKPVCDSPFIHAELSRAADTELCTQYAVETFGTARLVPCDAPVQIPQALYTAAAPITSTPFQPHVMIFDPVVNGALFADGGGTVTPSAVALTCAHSFDELISTLTSKYVINASTIKDWMRTDLTMLQSMSPNDFARILECVTNVLDQVSVCYELARCLGHAHLTCAHISAACSVCPYAVTEVAVAMVPFVGDVHYIGAVMDWLPVYEQPRVTSRLRLD